MILDRRAIEQAMYDAGLDPESGDLRDDYSGRGMYGSECFGIVGTAGQALAFAAALGAIMWDRDEEVVEWIAEAQMDNMGLSMIWYWPGVTLSEKRGARA